MNDEQLKQNLGANIVGHRKQRGLTQAELAEKLNYTDKAVSKWERGDSVPDILTLIQLAELFEVKVDDLLSDPNQLPEKTGAVVGKMEKAVEKTLKRKANKMSILGLSALLVWFVSLLSFVICFSLDVENCWMALIYAVPCDAVVRLCLLSAWRDLRWHKPLISVIIWGGALSLYLSLLLFAGLNIWMLFLLGIPGQIAVFLWFRMFYKLPTEEKNG